MPGNALKLEPWDTTQKDEGFPQVQGASPGSWGRSASPDSTARPATGLCGLECDEPPSPRNRSPNLRQRMVLSNRDKESLLEEIIDLKRALSDQAYHLKLHKVHYSAVQLENRKLEKDIEDLEVSGNLEAPRTGGPTRLRAKLQGLRTRLGDLQSTCDIQHDELCQLRRDIRVAHTRECEVERDVYAAEIGRLQKVVKRLKALQLKISTENRELSRLRDKAVRLTLANQRLKSCITIAHKTLERANKEVTSFRTKALESASEAKKSTHKIKELQEHAAVLEQLLEKERVERQKVQLKIKALALERKEWDRNWETKQKNKAIAAATSSLQAEKKKERKPKEVRKDKGAHATAYGSSDDSSGGSSDGKETMLDKKHKKEAFEAQKKATLQKLEERKNDLLKKVKTISHAFVEQEHNHYDKLIVHTGTTPATTSAMLPQNKQKQEEIETHLYQGVDGEALAFMEDVEEIHYGSRVPKPNLEGLSAKEAEKLNAIGKGGSSRPGSPSSGTRPGSPSSTSHGSRPGSPSSGTSTSDTIGTFDSSSYLNESESDESDGSGQTFGSTSTKDMKLRKDREGGKNGKKMLAEEFEEQKMSFLSKARKASQAFVENEQSHYANILSEIDLEVRKPGSVGWFSSTSSISLEDKQKEQVLEQNFYEVVEHAADTLLDHLEAVQYGADKGKVPRLKLKEMKAQEAAKLAREREERMLAQAEMEEQARKKVEKEAAERWASGQNKIDVMIDHAKLEEDEYSADVKEVKGRLSVEINLKRTSDHPYVGSPRALEEERRREEEARLAQEVQEALYRAQYEKQMEAVMNEREKEEQARREMEKKHMEIEEHRGLTADEDRRRQELEAKVAAGIPLTLEEEAELKTLLAKMRGKSGLTIREEIRLKELEAKIAKGIPLSPQEQAEFEALKARFRGKYGLTASEEARWKELEAKLVAGIPLSVQEEEELKLLRARLRLKSGLTAEEEARARELQAKLRSGIPLTAEEEAELRDLKADIIGKSGLTGREEARLRDLEEKLRSGIQLTTEEEAELKELRSRLRGKSGLTAGQESRLMDLEEKLRSGIPLTNMEEEELRVLRSQMIGKSGLTGGEEARLKELELKLNGGIALTPEEEVELKRLQKKLKVHNQLTALEDDRRLELEAKLASGIPLTEEEERELHELQAKRWGEWPLSVEEDTKRKELEEKLRSGIPLTPEEEEILRALQAKLKGKFPMTEFGEVDMTLSEEMRKKGKLPFIDKEMQGFIKENIRGVLGHLENITEVIVQKQAKLARHEVTALDTTGAAMNVLSATEQEFYDHEQKKQMRAHAGGSKPTTPRGHGGGSSPGTPRGHGEGSSPGTPRDHGGGSTPSTPRGEKPHQPHLEKGQQSRLGHKDEHGGNNEGG